MENQLLGVPKNVIDFTVKYYSAAKAAADATGMNVFIILAHAALEGGWGKSILASKYNNHFGYKAGSTWKGKTVTLKTKEFTGTPQETTINAVFRAFDTPEQGFLSYAQTMVAGRYKSVAKTTDPLAFASGIRKLGYYTGKESDYRNNMSYAFAIIQEVVKKKDL